MTLSKTTLILPACGNSTRFGDTRPKFLLTHPKGLSMLRASIDGLDLRSVAKIVIVVRKDHVEDYDFLTHLIPQFKPWLPKICVLDHPTQNQVETVTSAIKQMDIQGSIAIKDCDNYFRCRVPVGNFVMYSSLQDHQMINAGNKSYITKGSYNQIDTIHENLIAEEGNFCCGLYCFASAKEFYDQATSMGRQFPMEYVSDVIHEMTMKYVEFIGLQVKNYIDWGTYEDWIRYCGKFETLFVDIDGILVHNSGQFTKPYWGTTDGLEDNIKYLQERHQDGYVHIVLTTSRHAIAKRITMDQIAKLMIPYDQIVWGLPHCRRVLINDYARTNPYPSAYSVNLPRDADILRDLMQ